VFGGGSFGNAVLQEVEDREAADELLALGGADVADG